MSNPTTLIENFDGSLGAFTGVAPIRYDNGLWLEEATENIARNPDFVSSTSSWTNNGAGASISRLASGPLGGSYAQVVCAGAGSSEGIAQSVNSGDALVDQTWTLSAQLAGNAGGESLNLVLSQRNAASSGIGDVAGPTISITTAFARYARQIVTNQALTAFVRPKFTTAGTFAATFFADKVQLERKPYATSYADLSMGDGYTDGGSGETVRAASSASISPSGILAPGSGAVAFRISPTIETGLEEIWGECGVKGVGTDHLRWGRDASTHPFVEWSSNDAAYQRLTASETLAAGTAYDLYFGHTGTVTSLAVDAGTLQTGTRAAVSGDFSTGDLTLEASAGGVIYQPFATFNRTLTAKEIATLNGKNNWTMNVLAGNPYINFQLRPY